MTKHARIDEHGTLPAFRRGCRCEDCKQAGIDARKSYRSPRVNHNLLRITRWRCSECGQLNDTTLGARCPHQNPWETV